MSPPTSSKMPKPGSTSKSLSLKKPSPDKKGRQESMDKFIKKTDKSEGNYLYIFLASRYISHIAWKAERTYLQSYAFATALQ